MWKSFKYDLRGFFSSLSSKFAAVAAADKFRSLVPDDAIGQIVKKDGWELPFVTFALEGGKVKS